MSPILTTPPALGASVGADPGLTSRRRLASENYSVPALLCGAVNVFIRRAILVVHRLVTDRQTDRHRATAYTALAWRARKNTTDVCACGNFNYVVEVQFLNTAFKLQICIFTAQYIMWPSVCVCRGGFRNLR